MLDRAVEGAWRCYLRRLVQGLFLGICFSVVAASNDYPSPIFLEPAVVSEISVYDDTVILDWAGGTPPFVVEVYSSLGQNVFKQNGNFSNRKLTCTTSDSGSVKTELRALEIALPSSRLDNYFVLISDSLGNAAVRKFQFSKSHTRKSRQDALRRLLSRDDLVGPEMFSLRQSLGPVSSLNYPQLLLTNRIFCRLIHG